MKNVSLKTHKAILATACVILSAMASQPATAADSDGCWSGRHSTGPCVEYSTYKKNNKTYVEITNRCSDRVYVRWCVDDRCGADGIRGGQTKKKYEFTFGRTKVKAVGSNIPSKDWVCSGKVSDWRS